MASVASAAPPVSPVAASDPSSSCTRSWKAAREHPEVVQAATDKDVAAGFAVPYAQSPQFDTLFVSPLGLQEKSVVPPSPPAWRPINDWSMDNPSGSSINADTDVTVDVFDVFDVVAGHFIRGGGGGGGNFGARAPPGPPNPTAGRGGGRGPGKI